MSASLAKKVENSIQFSREPPINQSVAFRGRASGAKLFEFLLKKEGMVLRSFVPFAATLGPLLIKNLGGDDCT